jgi:hypothetical protein
MVAVLILNSYNHYKIGKKGIQYSPGLFFEKKGSIYCDYRQIFLAENRQSGKNESRGWKTVDISQGAT